MNNLPKQHKEPTVKPPLEQIMKSYYWKVWLLFTAETWIPLIIVGLIHKEPWPIILAVLAMLWLISSSKIITQSPVTKHLLPPLTLGGIAIAVLGFLNASGLFSLVLIFAIVIVFISSPSYAFKARLEEINRSRP